jgi:hypothetical protein
LHSNVEPGFKDVNENDPEFVVVKSEGRPRIGPPVSVVSGVPPTENRSHAFSDEPVFPAASVARTTRKYSSPFGTGPIVCGDVHG